jgi:hypothetical protein
VDLETRKIRCIGHDSKLHLINLKENGKAIWTVSSLGKFDIAATWEQLRTKKNEIPRWKLIWFCCKP